MKTYTYSAIDYSGRTFKGIIVSETIESASAIVGAKGIYVVTIDEVPGYRIFLNRLVQKAQIGRADILEFTQNFSIVLSAGIPIITGMDDLIMSTSNSAFKPVIRDIQMKLECGSSVSAALECHGELFPDIVKTLIAVGEETGRLEQSLLEASEYLQRMQNLSATIKKALIYPLFALIATLGALFFWMGFVIPSLTVTLKTMGVTLPALTRWLITFSDIFKLHWKLLLFTLLLMPLVIFLMGRNHKLRYLRDLVLIKLPVVKMISLNKLLATFSEQFRMLLAADIAIERLFELMIPALDNEYFAVKLMKAKDTILDGNPIAESLEQQNMLPPMVISKIRIGQTSGSLDKQLAFLTKYYTKKLDTATENLGKTIEPVMMVVIGGMFLVIIMGVLLPIYDLVSKVGRG